MNRRFLLLIAVLLGGPLLAACGSDNKSNDLPPNVIITLQPQPDATIVPGCPTRDLESWYEVAGTLVFTFTDESMQAVELQPQDMPSLINRLSTLRDAIAGQPVPECAMPVHTEIIIHIRGMMTAFQRYGNGELTQDDLRAQIGQAKTEIENQVAAMLADTQAGLEDQLQQQRAAATGTPEQ